MTRVVGVIGERQWQKFLKETVAPKFPYGLTVWEAANVCAAF